MSILVAYLAVNYRSQDCLTSGKQLEIIN